MSTTLPAGTPFFLTVFFTVNGSRLQLVQFSDPQSMDSQMTIPRGIELSLQEMETYLKDGTVRIDLRDSSTIPPPLLAYPRQLGCEAAAYVPILQEGQLRGLVLIGAREGQDLIEDVVNAFARTVRLTATSLTTSQSLAQPLDDRHAMESRSLGILASNAATMVDLKGFYASIHEQIRTVIGEFGCVIALYDQKTNSINIPYIYEDGKFSSI